MGDCGLTQSMQSFPTITLSPSFLVLSPLETYATAEDKAPLLLIIPKQDITAFHINMSDVILGLSDSRSVELDELLYAEYMYNKRDNSSDFIDYEVVEIKSGNGIVHIATMSRQLGLLTVLLRGDESSTNDYKLPVDIYFTVKIRIFNTTKAIVDSFPPETEILANISSYTDENFDLSSVASTIDGKSHSTQFSFRVRIGAVHDAEIIEPRFGEFPLSTYTNSVCRDNKIDARVLRYPQVSRIFRDGYVDMKDMNLNPGTEVILFEIDIESRTSIEHKPLQDIRLFMKYSLVNGSQFFYEFPLCDIVEWPHVSCELSLSQIVEQRRVSSTANWESSYIKNSQISRTTFRNIDKSAYVESDKGFYLLADATTKQARIDVLKEKTASKIAIVLPVPVSFSNFESSWLHLHVAIKQISPNQSPHSWDDSYGQACWSSLISWGGRRRSDSTETVFNSSYDIVNMTNTFLDVIDDVDIRSVRKRRLGSTFVENVQKDLTNKVVFEALSEFVDVVDGYDSGDHQVVDLYKKNAKKNSEGLRSRRLEDTYASSLLFVNRLLNRDFGAEQRKVPAHLPHLIDVEIMEEMQERWQDLWSNTSSHRFRSPHDMQYAFAYYYYVINRYKAKEPDLVAFFNNEIDTNRDGYVDDNEFRTVAAITRGKILTPEKILEYKKCALPELEYTEKEYSNHTIHVNSSLSNVTQRGDILQTLTVKAILNCTIIRDAFLDRMRKEKNYPLIPPTHSVGSEDDVSFEMIYDNATLTEQKLDSVRWRKTKFICLNDNANVYSPELEKVVRDFFDAMYPIPSPFELPLGQRNSNLYTSHYRQWMNIEVFLVCLADILGVILAIYVISNVIIYALRSCRGDFDNDYGNDATSSLSRKKKSKDKKKYI